MSGDLLRDKVRLGPAPCQLCRRHVFWNGRVWADADGLAHVCVYRRCLRCRKWQLPDAFAGRGSGHCRICDICREQGVMTPDERRESHRLAKNEYRQRRAA